MNRRPVKLELDRGWRLSADLSRPEVAVAAAELEQALGPPSDGVEIALACSDDGGEGFSRRASPRSMELRGDSPRGLLYGVYATLEELGERWSWPGERQGRAERAVLIDEELVGEPALPGRCLVLGERALLEGAEDWIVWAGRHRINSIFVHVGTAADPVGAAPEQLWLERRDRLVALARERGMTLEHGGHLLPELLPAAQLRALARGEPLGAEWRRAVERHALTHPEAEVLHLWGVDVPAGAGRGREASEAALRTANTLAESVKAARPEAQLGFLAYHETEDVPRGVRPRQNVSLTFAPRERCYDHALTDPSCGRNARYRDLVSAQVEHFRAAGAAPPRVFEYWFDAILFSGGVPDLSGPMADDLGFYRDAGLHTVQMLITGHGGPPSPHPNPAAFARLCWDPDSRLDRDRDPEARGA